MHQVVSLLLDGPLYPDGRDYLFSPLVKIDIKNIIRA
jgi:hypothetical protein